MPNTTGLIFYIQTALLYNKYTEELRNGVTIANSIRKSNENIYPDFDASVDVIE